MEKKVILLDTSVLIDHFRKKIKTKSLWYHLTRDYNSFSVSVITQYEIFSGSNELQETIWNDVFEELTIFSLTPEICKLAVEIEKQ